MCATTGILPFLGLKKSIGCRMNDQFRLLSVWFCVLVLVSSPVAFGQDGLLINHGNWIPKEEVKNPVFLAPEFSKFRTEPDFHQPVLKKKEGLFEIDFFVVGPKGDPLEEATVAIFKKQKDFLNPKRRDKYKFVAEFQSDKKGIASARFWVSDRDEFQVIASSKDGRVKFTEWFPWARISWRKQYRLRLVPTVAIEIQLVNYKTDAPIPGAEFVLSPFGSIEEVDKKRFPTGKTDESGCLRVSNWPITSSVYVFATHPRYHNFKKPIVKISNSAAYNNLKNEGEYSFNDTGDIPEEGFELTDVYRSLFWRFCLIQKKRFSI